MRRRSLTAEDAIGIDPSTGNSVIEEYKASLTAPLTANQENAFDLLRTNGGKVVRKQ